MVGARNQWEETAGAYDMSPVLTIPHILQNLFVPVRNTGSRFP